MKWFLILSLLLFSACANRSNADSSDLQADSINNTVQTNKTPDLYEESIRINKENIAKLEIQNKPFTIVPAEFQNVDFNNFTYPTDYPKKSVTLKDGKFQYETTNDLGNLSGGGDFKVSKIYYLDLTGDNVKEALVFLFRVDCGASCDGGSYLVYVYGIKQNKPNLLWNLFLGSQAYECGLKSFAVKERRISFEIYSDCTERNHKLEEKAGTKSAAKGSSYGLTEFSYKFNGKSFIREKAQTVSQELIGHLNILPEVSINE